MLTLANMAGWVMAHGRQLIVGVLLLAVILTSAIIYTRCTRVKPMTPAQIQKAQSAIAKEDREEMKEVFAEAAADEAVADKNVEDAEAAKQFALAEAEKKADAMSNQELADYLNQRAKE